METAGWNALLKKKENFKISVKDIEFFVVSHHGHLSGFSEALYAAMGKKAILNIVSIHHNDEHIMRAIRRKLMPSRMRASDKTLASTGSNRDHFLQAELVGTDPYIAIWITSGLPFLTGQCL